MAITASVVTVGTTATQLSGIDTDAIPGESIAISNTGTATVYIGGAGVTAAAGFPVAAGNNVSIDLPPNSVLYGVVASGSGTVSVLAAGV